jgi:hypothetical protein
MKQEDEKGTCKRSRKMGKGEKEVENGKANDL